MALEWTLYLCASGEVLLRGFFKSVMASFVNVLAAKRKGFLRRKNRGRTGTRPKWHSKKKRSVRNGGNAEGAHRMFRWKTAKLQEGGMLEFLQKMSEIRLQWRFFFPRPFFFHGLFNRQPNPPTYRPQGFVTSFPAGSTLWFKMWPRWVQNCPCVGLGGPWFSTIKIITAAPNSWELTQNKEPSKTWRYRYRFFVEGSVGWRFLSFWNKLMSTWECLYKEFSRTLEQQKSEHFWWIILFQFRLSMKRDWNVRWWHGWKIDGLTGDHDTWGWPPHLLSNSHHQDYCILFLLRLGRRGIKLEEFGGIFHHKNRALFGGVIIILPETPENESWWISIMNVIPYPKEDIKDVFFSKWWFLILYMAWGLLGVTNSAARPVKVVLFLEEMVLYHKLARLPDRGLSWIISELRLSWTREPWDWYNLKKSYIPFDAGVYQGFGSTVRT